jgi:serine/threonine-protein kinase
MKLFEAPDSAPDVKEVALSELPDESLQRPWWQSRGVRIGVAALVLLIAFGIAVKPIVSEKVNEIMATLYAVRGESEFWNGDLPAALGLLDQSVEYAPDDPAVLFMRAEFREKNNDLSGALEDYDRVIKLSPTYSAGYAGRANVYRRMGRYDAAVEDLTTALRNQPAWEPEYWNHRAYVRALGDVDLPAALDDVEEAIRLSSEENANYLDTRGLIHHKQGNNALALTDLDRAIQLTEAQKEQWKRQAEKESIDPRRRKVQIAQFNHALAVMYHHRSLTQQALEHPKNAEEDAAKARQLGYDPAKGIE